MRGETESQKGVARIFLVKDGQWQTLVDNQVKQLLQPNRQS